MIFSKSLIGDALFSYLVLILENERNGHVQSRGDSDVVGVGLEGFYITIRYDGLLGFMVLNHKNILTTVKGSKRLLTT